MPSRDKDLTRQSPASGSVKPLPSHQSGGLVRVEQSSVYIGPLPDPATLAEFEQVLPGSAERIFARFERQSDHRMRLEDLAIRGENFRANFGLGSATTIVLSCIAGGLWAILTGHDAAGGAMVAAGLGSGVGVFIVGRKRQERERERKGLLATQPDKQ